MFDYDKNELYREIFHKTHILRKPISGIVSGYHELPYILVAPDDNNESASIEVNGKINVSPKFIITPNIMLETFGDVFDPQTFDRDLQGRFFSFAYSNKKNIKIESEYFQIKNVEANPQEHLNKINDKLCMEENVRTALIYGPKFKFYPISIDKFINEILDREFRL